MQRYQKKKSRCYETKGNYIADCILALEIDIAPYIYNIRNQFFKKEKQMWIAKNRITGEEYGTPNKSIMKIQDYINTDLKVLNKFLYLVETEKRELFKTGYNGANIIQCYNKAQKRWADGFDY